MRLEGADVSFGDIMTMDIRGKEFELFPPLLLNVELVGCAVLVFKDFVVDNMVALGEAGHDPICSSKVVAVVAGFEWIQQDDIGVHMVGEHE